MEYSLDNNEDCDMVLLNHALVILVRFWENCDKHCEGSVVVEETQEKPDSPKDDETVMMKDNNSDCHEDIDDENGLTGSQTPAKVLQIIQDFIRKAGGEGHMVMGHREADSGGQESR